MLEWICDIKPRQELKMAKRKPKKKSNSNPFEGGMGDMGAFAIFNSCLGLMCMKLIGGLSEIEKPQTLKQNP